MKLLGVTNGKKVIASMAHYDCVFEDDLMADSGQPLTNHYGGYSRFSVGGDKKVVWFEVPQNFAELYYDYNCNNQNRKYGIWNIEDVKILDESEYPDTDSIEEKSKNFIWGHRGINQGQPLQYVLLCERPLDHLRNILKNVPNVHSETKEVIEYLIFQKSAKQS